jgi:hypothetical protein
MKIPRWVVAAAAGFATILCARAGDPYSVRDVDSAPVKDLSLDITQVELFQSENHRMVFKVAFATPPDIDRLRILLDVDGPGRGEPDSGADYMLEGANFYRYPKGATAWTWDAIEPPFTLVEGRTVTCVLPDIPGLTTVADGRWIVETTFADWKTADRVPKAGALNFNFEKLSTIPLETRIYPEDISEFVANAPASLCFRFDSELKSWPWKELSASENPMAWTPALASTSLPLRLMLSDAVTHESVNLEPDKTFAASNAVKWTGKSLGIEWAVVMEPLSNGSVRLTGQLESPVKRCVRVGVGCEVDLNGWTWHDDVRFRRTIQGSNQYANVVACPFGMRGDRSLYPFGVISSERGSLIAETDINEPRIFQVVADARDSFFGVCYDLGITALTSNFPGRVAFRCVLRASKARGGDPFRRALESFYAEQPDVLNRTVPEVGVWLPFTDPGTISNVQDFGFAYIERLAGGALNEIAGRGMLSFGYTEPWLYWLPIQADVKRTDEEVIHRMKVLAAGGDRRAELAASALLGAARRPDGSINMRFADLPWNSGARMEVNTDPELAPTPDLPVNRAMAEWREVKRILADSRMTGIYLDSMAEARSADYSPAAMGVADYPCTFQADVLEPCLPMEWSEFEYVGAISRAMKARNKFVMGNFACANPPFFMKYVDVPGEELECETPGRYDSLDPRMANFRRAMSGRKPFVFLLNTSFDKISAADIAKYFKECLSLGFLPGFFSEDGFHNPYWSNPVWYNRDRPNFKSYVPLIRRLAAGGWMPVGFASSHVSTLWVECFNDVVPGVRHITLRNSKPAPVKTDVEMAPHTEPLLVIDPLSAECVLIESNQTRFPVMMSGSEIEMRDIIPVSLLNSELAFARSWNSGAGEAAACLKVIESVRGELHLGAACNVSYPAPAVLGETNVFNLVIQNNGTQRLEIGDLKIITTKQFRPFETALKTVEPGGSLMVNGFYCSDDMGKDPWLEVQWTVSAGDRQVVCTRMINPRYPAVDLQLFRSRVRR